MIRAIVPALMTFTISVAVADERRPTLPGPERAKLESWYDAVGAPREGESFGHYLARAARVQHGVGYEEHFPPPGQERLHVNLDAFECVSFIESSLAVARCGFGGETTSSCFARELMASRYRGGDMGNYASRLHYFVDWIYDNEARGRLRHLTPELGGRPVKMDFYYITSREIARAVVPPGGELAALTRELARTESRLSATTHAVLSRDDAPAVLGNLQDGDLVAFVRERPGLLVHHAGFIYWANGTPRLLHASSYHKRVVITATDVIDYLLRRPERRGVLVARPIPPVK